MPTRSRRREAAEEWAPVLTLYFGMLILVFCAVFWAFTNRLEPMFLATGGALLGTSQGLDALDTLRRGPPAPPDTTVSPGEETP